MCCRLRAKKKEEIREKSRNTVSCLPQTSQTGEKVVDDPEKKLAGAAGKRSGSSTLTTQIFIETGERFTGTRLYKFSRGKKSQKQQRRIRKGKSSKGAKGGLLVKKSIAISRCIFGEKKKKTESLARRRAPISRRSSF